MTEIVGSEAAGREQPQERDEIERLSRAARTVLLVLAAVVGVAGAACIVLVQEAHSDDLRVVAGLALAGGALGAAARGIFETIERLAAGWELADGTVVERRALRRARARERWLAAHGAELARLEAETPPDSESTKARHQTPGERLDALRRELEESERDAAFPGALFSSYEIPFLVGLPVIGAALGLTSFAGVAGGFLVATGDRSPDFSPPGLLFVAVLAGLFAESFVRALARGADALFGTTSPSRGRRSE